MLKFWLVILFLEPARSAALGVHGGGGEI